MKQDRIKLTVTHSPNWMTKHGFEGAWVALLSYDYAGDNKYCVVWTKRYKTQECALLTGTERLPIEQATCEALVALIAKEKADVEEAKKQEKSCTK